MVFEIFVVKRISFWVWGLAYCLECRGLKRVLLIFFFYSFYLFRDEYGIYFYIDAQLEVPQC